MLDTMTLTVSPRKLTTMMFHWCDISFFSFTMEYVEDFRTILLTYFSSVFHFYTPRKRQKALCLIFRMFWLFYILIIWCLLEMKEWLLGHVWNREMKMYTRVFRSHYCWKSNIIKIRLSIYLQIPIWSSPRKKFWRMLI